MPSDIAELTNEQLHFVTPSLPQAQAAPRYGEDDHPFVTLTYACSLDGMISLSPGVRTTLSGTETKSMTHFLRLHHDAILVGVGTAIADHPSLNCRYPGITLDKQPQPIIVDPNLRWQASGSPVVELGTSGKGKLPWVLCGEGAEVHKESTQATLVPVRRDGNRLDWRDILRELKARGIQSIMIEGGATILNDLLTQPDLVDAVIVTIAPTWLGQGGVHVSPSPQGAGQRINAATLSGTSWMQFGADVVLCGRLTAK